MNEVGKNKKMRTYKEIEEIVKRYLSATKLAKEINTTDKMSRAGTPTANPVNESFFKL